MEDAEAWRKAQIEEIKAIKDEAKKWQTDLRKEARDWYDSVLRDLNSWKYDIEDEIEALKGEPENGHKRTARKGAGSEDLLGSSTGESDQTEADNSSGRKRRSSSSRTK